MRYETWDVLLFPASSRVPIQEFKTQCFVTRDLESPYLQSPEILGPIAFYRSQASVGRIPVLTSFIPSLVRGAAFRISIHNWDKPKPSRLIESMMQPDDVLLYEARVFIDGECVAAGVFGQRAAWPYVIGIDRDGNQDYLRFPQFHSEILEQRHWDAGDAMGRIKIMLSEGFSRPNRSPPFERVKDAIIFSFQHAPEQILEFSQIAWPNPSMWGQDIPRPLYNGVQGSLDPKEPDDIHAHSPRKRETCAPMTSMALVASTGQFSTTQAPIVSNNAWAAGRAFPLPTSQWHAQSQAQNPRWTGQQGRYQEAFIDPSVDPFINDPTWRHRGARSSRDDVPMPDYSSNSSRAISSMTEMSYELSKHLDSHKASHYSPPPSSAAAAMATLMPTANDTPATIRKASSQTPGAGRTLGLRERSQASSRDVSDSVSIPAEKGSPTKIGASPSANVKSRKEGDKEKEKEKENDQAQKENESVGSSSTSTSTEL
ncbi:uncharacterized protein N7473_006832 [Penicillium subrubescens]|uniref:uncharacterized protein n=1 Tax=Penicillium subrubescens TaxID=1316194 RepID=UPI0025455ADA|nr:uncharacterized protein N7473_006832 [Penicillium subrubescens]KAJ5890604.1 hypothetical protein N7473_006832 [Penicillium subrubescens]